MKCKIDNCPNDATHIKLQLCNAHYHRFRRHGQYELPKTRREQLIEIGKSYCPKCEKVKRLKEFNKDNNTAFGIAIYCRVCTKIKSSNQYKNNKRNHKNTQLKSTFGITMDDYDLLLVKQNGSCAICKTEPTDKHLSVDHCHITGKVRGLLCNRCNLGLGYFKDDHELLKIATDYLTTAVDCV